MGPLNLNVDVRLISQFAPSIAEELPLEQEMEIGLKFTKAHIDLKNIPFESENNAQITVSIMVETTLRKSNDPLTLFKDTFATEIGLNIKLIKNMIQLSIQKWTFSTHDKLHDPPVNRININTAEYKSFTNGVQFILVFIQRYFNIIVFKEPIQLPIVGFLELNSEIEYQEDALIFLFDLNIVENIG